MRDDPYPPDSRRPGDMLALDDRFDTPDATDPDFWPLGDDGTPIGEVPERPRGNRWGRWIMRGLGVGIILLVLIIAWLAIRSEEHTSELQSLMRISYAVFCLKKKKRI